MSSGGGGGDSPPPTEGPEQQLDRALELVERRVLHAADAGRPVQPAVDLGVAAPVAAAQVGDEAVALVAQERAALESGWPLRLELGHRGGGRHPGPPGGGRGGRPPEGARGGGAPKSASWGATSAASGTNAGSSARSVSRCSGGSSRANGSPSVGGRRMWRSSRSTSAAWARSTGSAGR